MGKTIIDILFSVLVLVAIILHYFIAEDISTWEFYMALMLNYFGSRYLLMSNLDYAIYEAALETDDE